MWTVIEEPRVCKLTPALAKRFAEMEPCPHDRPLRDSRLAGLRRIIEREEFRYCEWTSAICEETGLEYRINGKHTSTVFAGMNGSMPKCSVVVSKYSCPTLEDVAKLYSGFDSRLSTRSTGDINRVYAASNPDLALLAAKTISVATTGISFSMWETTYASHPAEERAQIMVDNAEFVVWFALLITSKCNLTRGPVCAAMFKTWSKAKQQSTEFWTLVRDGSGASHTSPDRVLSRILDTSSVDLGRGALLGKKRFKAREMYVKCLHAWNAWRDGTATDLKYYAKSKTPAAK